MRFSTNLLVGVGCLISVTSAFDYTILDLNRTIVDCTVDEPCGQCQGDCDNDDQCSGDLICFQKEGGPTNHDGYIPSCKGSDPSVTDWCIVDIRNGNPTQEGGDDPTTPLDNSPRVELVKPVVDCTVDGPCHRCEGHCASDDECEGHLVCFKKSHGPADSDKFIPSCLGVDTSRTDWCVEPNWAEPENDEGQIDNEPSDRGELMILAYYYPWYYSGDWSRHGLQGNKPLLGFYGTDEPAVAEQHNDWAERAGIDAWVVSWWGKDRVADTHFFRGMLQASNLNKMKFCMLYELGALVTNDFSDGTRAIDDWVGDMIYFRDNFFDHPQYISINGKPMVVLYLTRNYRNFKPEMVKEVQRRVGVDMFFVADTPYFGSNRRPDLSSTGIVNGKPVFEAYTSYNMFTHPAVRNGETARDYMFREGLPIYKEWAAETTYFPQVLPMYHDFRGHPQLIGDTEGMREQLEEFACLNKPKGNKYPNMMFMTSWNEWWEGSQLEPDEAGKYGFTFIDELRRFKDAGPANC